MTDSNNERGQVYTYTCPICGEEYYAHLYHTPQINDGFVCHCGHNLVMVSIDNDNKTIDCRAIQNFSLAV